MYIYLHNTKYKNYNNSANDKCLKYLTIKSFSAVIFEDRFFLKFIFQGIEKFNVSVNLKNKKQMITF